MSRRYRLLVIDAGRAGKAAERRQCSRLRRQGDAHPWLLVVERQLNQAEWMPLDEPAPCGPFGCGGLAR